MATPRMDEALAMVAALAAIDVAATTDPAVAVAKAPCVLVPPPAILPPTRELTWSVVALASSNVGGPKAWAELDALVDKLLDLWPVERATPTSYTLPDGSGSRPAYVLTITGSA